MIIVKYLIKKGAAVNSNANSCFLGEDLDCKIRNEFITIYE